MNDARICQKPRRLPLPEREIVEKQIDEWVWEGIIEPYYSEYASPVVVVRKKDGTLREKHISVTIDERSDRSVKIRRI